jgi:hypothetical protein
VQEILENQPGAKRRDDIWNFDNVKTLLMFCNGPWCGQSSTTIKDLLKIGYPAHKILWYRGGMQDWESLGLTTVNPSLPEPVFRSIDPHDRTPNTQTRVIETPIRQSRRTRDAPATSPRGARPLWLHQRESGTEEV